MRLISYFFVKKPSTIYYASFTPDKHAKCSRIVLWIKLNESMSSLPFTLLNKIPLNNAYFLLSCKSNNSFKSSSLLLTYTLLNNIILLAISRAYYWYSLTSFTIYLEPFIFSVYFLSSLSNDNYSNISYISNIPIFY